MFAGFDDACCDLDPHRRNGLHLTDNDMWRSHGSKANFSIAQCERKKSDQPPKAWRPVAKARFRGGGNRTRVYITDPKKNCLAGFATIERILR
jgi:hypothetical protein